MSIRVYLSKNTCQTTPEEDTPVCLRIQLSRATVKALHRRLQHAYRRDEVRLVRRTTVLLDLLVPHVPVAVLKERWGLSPACLYDWQKAFLLRGLDRLVYGQGGGRRPKLSPRQTPRLVELSEAGPRVVGCETAGWPSVLIRVLSWRECGGLYHCQYVCTLLHNLGGAFHKARFVSDHLDAARRQQWRQQAWPMILRAAPRHKGLMLFEDEARFAQWGSLSYTWARRGQQPEVTTSGKRKGYKVCGAIEYFSGRLFSRGSEGRCTSDSYQTFVQTSLAQTQAHVFFIHDGARDHTSKATQQFFADHAERLTACPLPSYSPDDNPIEYLWQKTKQRATHKQYFKEFAAVTVSVDKALASFATHPDTVLGLFGLYCEESGLELTQAA
jgi:transposase